MKKYIIMAVVVLVVGGLAFYAGTKFSTNSAAASSNGFPRNGTGFTSRNGSQQGSGFVGGDIIAKDDKSITVQLRSGGSKIVFLSGSTSVTKFTQGSVSDLNVGEQVSVNGSANPDGSVSAQSIQIRPAELMPSNQPQSK